MAAQTSVIHMARLPLGSKENNTPLNNTHTTHVGHMLDAEPVPVVNTEH